MFSGDYEIQKCVERSQSLLLLAGGVYLLFIFLGWLFLKEKEYAFLVERFIHRQSIWFYAFVSIIFTLIIYISIKINALLALSASIDSTAFFITDGFKKMLNKKKKNF